MSTHACASFRAVVLSSAETADFDCRPPWLDGLSDTANPKAEKRSNTMATREDIFSMEQRYRRSLENTSAGMSGVRVRVDGYVA